MITLVWVIGSTVIGTVAAWLAGRFMTGNGFGLLGDIIAGVLAAVLGGAALHLAGIDLGAGVSGRLIVSSISAAIVLFLVHFFTGRRHGQRVWS